MNTVHNDAKNFALTVSPLTNPFDEDVNDPIHQASLLDKREIAGDQEGHNPMSAGPDSLRYLFHILTVELPGFDAAPHRLAKTIETFLPGLGLVLLRELFPLNERNDIVIGIV